MAFSLETRKKTIAQLKKMELDVLIIGGGITGAGVAVQASAAKMKTGLIERQDFAEGTSSRSTKLIHGGLRYLKNFDVEVVADTVTERAVVQSIAPHIPKAAPMLLPIYAEAGATFNMFSVKVAMDLYDRLATITDSQYANTLLTAEEVLKRQPYLKKANLLGGGVYLDYKNDDSRLVIENIKQAAADGGYIVSRVQAVGFIYAEKQVVGVKAKDRLTGEVFEIQAKVVINTGGPWADEIRQLAESKDVTPRLRPTKGVHLVIDISRLAVSQPTYLDTGKKDGRMFFVVPREGKTYFGTTDTDYQGDYAQPKVEQADITYLLDCLNYCYPEANITLADIESSWVGLRPLIASNSGSDYNGGGTDKLSDASFNQLVDVVAKFETGQVNRSAVEKVVKTLKSSQLTNLEQPSAVSRGSHLEREADGLITLAGGKITDYRKMAEGALKQINKVLLDEFGLVYQLIDSKKYQISGGKFNPKKVEETLARYVREGIDKGLSEGEATALAERYGSNVLPIFEQLPNFEGFKQLSLGESLSLNYAMTEEMTLTPADYLMRRTTHILFQRDQLKRLKKPVIDAMAAFYKWTKVEKDQYSAELAEVIKDSDLGEFKKTQK